MDKCKKHDYNFIHEVAQDFINASFFERNPGECYLTTMEKYDGGDINTGTFFKLEKHGGVIFATPWEDISDSEKGIIRKSIIDGCPEIDDGDDGFEISPFELALVDAINHKTAMDSAIKCVVRAHGENSVRGKFIKEKFLKA